MNIDGRNTLACTTAIADIAGDVAIYPLPHMAVIKDLVTDFTHFFAQYAGDRALAADRLAARPSASGARRPRIGPGWTACTNASCAPAARPPARATGGTPSGSWVPAVLLQAYRWLADSRDEHAGERLHELEDPFRLYRCHTIMNCTNTCPKGLNPAKAIAEIKKLMVDRHL